ncbi:MAG: chemotaxis protein CheR [Bacteroidetes bacterium]|nr:chemotaxis protein CheR [Bacteroidota bacterium]
MGQILSNTLLLQLSEFIASNLALHFPENHWDVLERNITLAAKEFGFQDVQKFIKHIIASPLTRNHSELLASHLTINETYFWREANSFKVLEQKILPKLIQLRQKEKRIKIWSAGCSTGEEPYSIAIAINKLIPDLDKWDITILATDINPKILSKAKTGIYNQWSFRNTPQWLKKGYFIQKKIGKFEIIQKIKNMVTFKYLNLAEDVFPSPLNYTNAIDIIYCRNVLMYFTQERFRQIAQKFHQSLIDNGYLIVSSSELSYQNFTNFIPINFSDMLLYQKAPKKIKKQTNYSVTDNSQKPIINQMPSKPNSVFKIPKYRPIEIKNAIHNEKKRMQQIDLSYEKNLKLYMQGNYDALINKLQNRKQTPEEQILLIRAYANLGKLNEALKLCKKSISSNKLNYKTHYLYATILQENNMENEAEAILKKVINLNPNFVLSYYSLGMIFLRNNNVTDTTKCFEKILSIIHTYSQDEILPESEGLTAGRFREIINATIKR